MKLTLEKLKKNKVDKLVVEWFIEQNDTNVVSLINKAFESGREEVLDFFNFVIDHFLNRTGRIKYAVFAAEQVVGIFEKKYPKENRIREAIDAAKNVIENDSKINRKHAEDAFEKAFDVAYKAIVPDDSVSMAADVAAFNAADSAVHAAATAADGSIRSRYAGSAYSAKSATDSIYSHAAYSAYCANKDDHAGFIASAAEAAYGMKIKILRYGITLIEEMEGRK